MSDIRRGLEARGPRGERGRRGHEGPIGPTGPAGPSIPQFEPARTLFVSPVWPAGVDPAVYFTDIPSAIAQAETLVPPLSLANPAAIVIYPGTYPENITMPSSGLVLMNPTGVFVEVVITGTITWTPTGSVAEVAWFYFLRIANTVMIDTTGKTGGQTSLLMFNCFPDEVDLTGRSAAGPTRDLFQCMNCVPGMTPFTFSDAEVEWESGRLNAMSFSGACVFSIIGSTTIPAASAAWEVNDTSTGNVTGCLLTTPWNVNDTASVAFAGSTINQPITVAAGAYADLRAANYNGDGNLAGPGPTDRTTLTTSFGPTMAGPNDVFFLANLGVPPFSDNNYNVVLQLTAQLVPNPNSPAVTVTLKNSTDFTINDPVGGNTYDIIVNHD